MAKRKYGNEKVTVNGYKFDSRAEARYYLQLLGQVKSGKVVSFEMQKRFKLLDRFEHPETGKTVRAIYYIPDFVVKYPDGTTKVIDVKGAQTAVFKLKAKLFMERYKVPLILAKYDYRHKLFTHTPA